MQVEDIIKEIEADFEGVIPKSSWGETSLFYNLGKLLSNGVYFCTLKEKNGDNDKASELDREGIFRLSIGIAKKTTKSTLAVDPRGHPKEASLILPMISPP